MVKPSPHTNSPPAFPSVICAQVAWSQQSAATQFEVAQVPVKSLLIKPVAHVENAVPRLSISLHFGFSTQQSEAAQVRLAHVMLPSVNARRLVPAVQPVKPVHTGFALQHWENVHGSNGALPHVMLSGASLRW